MSIFEIKEWWARKVGDDEVGDSGDTTPGTSNSV